MCICGKHHPLAKEESISFSQLSDYPCLAFEQGDNSSFYLAEEILSTNEYPRIIRANDRATMLNLMVGLNGYTLCSGIICEELNGNEFCGSSVPGRRGESQQRHGHRLYHEEKIRCPERWGGCISRR